MQTTPIPIWQKALLAISTVLLVIACVIFMVSAIANPVSATNTDYEATITELEKQLAAKDVQIESLSSQLEEALAQPSEPDTESLALIQEQADTIGQLRTELEATRTANSALEEELKAAQEKNATTYVVEFEIRRRSSAFNTGFLAAEETASIRCNVTAEEFAQYNVNDTLAQAFPYISIPGEECHVQWSITVVNKYITVEGSTETF